MILLRLVVRDPVPGVALAVQRGRDALVPPARADADATTFELRLAVRARRDATREPWGPEVQGPPDRRFVYVNVGTYAGQPGTPWSRRAKVPLAGITDALRDAAERPGAALDAAIAGRGRDGTPACASVPLLDGWRVVDA
ncbi:DUF5990 family protein [Roseisolibacter sp. H3M3-2]|uniref:DUF5990 family protein n=1 Tax=Roseisolibacter sp. H3M3-2 TaxID=3031323 RepID=UPI0023DBC7C9|nr:DUF5990 family protein [Roseisolibacter sp. H3M3-2]MDF1506410.1 DUF5990 family protein [Roseisolibacter sp. H3M3-2]